MFSGQPRSSSSRSPPPERRSPPRPGSSSRSPPPERRGVTLLHISDTHMLHRTLHEKDLPAADILVHTGDFTNNGTDAEFADFNDWLRSQRPRFKHIVVICGNHEFRTRPLPPDVLSGDFAKRRLSNATHVLHHEMANIEGINFFGSPWSPWSEYEDPDVMPYNAAHVEVFKQWSKKPESRDSSGAPRVNLFDQIPIASRVDVLLTHGPPRGIFDKMETTTQSWGSSRRLRALLDGGGLGVGAHLFGHLHEQRGYWEKRTVLCMQGGPGVAHREWVGGCEYEARPGVKLPTFAPPSVDYGCRLISCNAMKNHGGLDGRQDCIAGPGRLIYARLDPRTSGVVWCFSVSP